MKNGEANGNSSGGCFWVWVEAPIELLLQCSYAVRWGHRKKILFSQPNCIYHGMKECGLMDVNPPPHNLQPKKDSQFQQRPTKIQKNKVQHMLNEIYCHVNTSIIS
jgi:hypothetical protein